MTVKELSTIVGNTVPYLNVLGICVGLFYLSRSRLNDVFKFVLAYLEICLIFNYLMEVSVHFFKTNLFLIPIFGFVELLFFTYLFAALLNKKNPRTAASIVITGGLGLSYILFDIFANDPLNSSGFQTYARVVDAVLIVFFCMTYFYNTLANEIKTNQHVFLLISGILVYYSLNVILLLPINFMINDASQLKFYFWFAYTILMILFYIFLTYTLWRSGKTP